MPQQNNPVITAEEIIRQWQAVARPQQPVAYLAKDNHPLNDPLEKFCRTLGQSIPGLKLLTDRDKLFCRPAIIVGRHKNIAYQTEPGGPELGPFLDALAMDRQAIETLSPQTGSLLEKITQPIDFILYIATQCPHCPQVVRRLWPLAAMNPHIRLTIVDAAIFAKQAQDHNVRSVPLLLLDETYRWNGLTDVDEILTMCLERDPSLMSPTSLRRIIEDGDAEAAARMMMDSNAVFPALTTLLTDEKWSVRLGAMVVAEYLADEAPELAETLSGLLWKNFEGHPAQVQGDIAYIFGLIDSEDTVEYLKAITAGPYDTDVKQAATEALT